MSIIKAASIGLRVSFVASCLSGLVCCGDNAGESSLVDSTSVSSPSDLVDRFNNLVTNDLFDARGMLSMLHAENELQVRMLDVIRTAIPIYELDALMRAEYAVPLESTAVESFFAPFMRPARLIEQDSLRAVAEFIDCNRKTQRLHLVHTGGRWRVSLFSFEYDESIKSAFARNAALGMGAGTQERISIAPGIIARIKANEFRSGTQAAKAIEDAIRQR